MKEFKEKKSILHGNLNKNSLDLKKKEKKSGIDFKESRSWNIKENLKS